MTLDLKKKLLQIKASTSGSDLSEDGQAIWEICNQAAFKISELEALVSLMEKSFITEVTAAVDCNHDDEWNQWGVDMMNIMSYTNDELGYRTGESERIALATVNSELRSQLLSSKQELETVLLEIKNLLEVLITTESIEEAIQISEDALMYFGEKYGISY
jgi:hypothetical protein